MMWTAGTYGLGGADSVEDAVYRRYVPILLLLGRRGCVVFRKISLKSVRNFLHTHYCCIRDAGSVLLKKRRARFSRERESTSNGYAQTKTSTENTDVFSLPGEGGYETGRHRMVFGCFQGVLRITATSDKGVQKAGGV